MLFNRTLLARASAVFLLGAAMLAQADTATVQAWPDRSAAVKVDAALEARVEQLLNGLSLRQKIGQMTQPEIRAITPEQVREYAIGSVLNGGGGWPGNNINATPADWRALSEAFQKAALEATPGSPLIWGIDAVHGNNNVRGAVIYPHNIGLGASGNAQLVRDIGRATARAVRATGQQWAFAPTLAVVQHVRWGRTYESFGNDPALVARLGRAAVEGLQENLAQGIGVLASAKHFVGDGGTRHGTDQGITRATPEQLAKTHGAGYIATLDAGVQTVMASYSSWTDTRSATPNGKMHGNRELLTDVLKQRLAFDGLIVSDWDAIGQVPGCKNDDCVPAVLAGTDVFMVPFEWKRFIDNTLRAVQDGRIPMSRIDDAVRRILRVKLRAGLAMDGKVRETDATFATDADRALARRAVRESLVLLKHKPGLLPLPASSRVLVVGAAADNIHNQTGGWSRTWQGHETTNADFPAATSLLAALRQRLGSGNVVFDADGSREDPAKFSAVVAVLAEKPYAEMAGDIGLTSSLKHSRRYPEQLAALQRVAGRGAPVVTLLYSGRPLDVNDAANRSDAFIAAWLPGSEGAGLVDALVAPEAGKTWPGFSARLRFPWPGGPCQFSTHPDPKATGADKPWWPVGGGLSGFEKTASPAKALPEWPEPKGICPVL